jgi:hypothetical protein
MGGNYLSISDMQIWRQGSAVKLSPELGFVGNPAKAGPTGGGHWQADAKFVGIDFGRIVRY